MELKLAEKIQLLRKQRGLSQEQLAEQLGVSRQSVSKWESGLSMPEVGNVMALCQIFSISSDDLIDDNRDLPVGQIGEGLVVPEPPISVIFCTQCGRENAADSGFCGYCGHAFTEELNTANDNYTKGDVELSYYRTDLSLQQQQLRTQQQQGIIQAGQYQLQTEQYGNMAKCPRCGSTSLSAHKKGYSFAKGCLGAVITIPIITIISVIIFSIIGGNMLAGVLIGLAIGGVVGPVVPLVAGLLFGSVGGGKLTATCLNCGHRFKS